MRTRAIKATKIKAATRLVVWPRPPEIIEGEKVHRYVILGMVMTGTPIEGLEDKNEVIIDDGKAHLLAEFLTKARKRKAKIVVGDALSALLSLDLI